MKQRLVIAVVLSFVRTAVAAPDRAACLSAYEEGQVGLRGSSLLEARDRLTVCSRSPCPAALQPECVRWLEQVERRIPSIVVTLRTAAGEDVADAKLYLDDRLVASRLDGRALELDPGPHRVRLEAGTEHAETAIVAAENVKGRVVALVLPAPPKTAAPKREKEAPAMSEERPIPTLTWIGLGAGALGLATFGVVGLGLGEAKYGELESCHPACAPDDVSQARTLYAIADVGLAVGVVGLGVALTAWLLAPSRQTPRLALKSWK